MILHRALLLGVTTGLVVARIATAAYAQDPAEKQSPAKTPAGPSMADFNRLQNEVHEQRQLIVQMMQSEQQRYEMLLKLLRVQGGATLPEMPRAAPIRDHDEDATAPVAVEESAEKPTERSPNGSQGKNSGISAGNPDRRRKNGSVVGHVGLPGGGEVTDVYVFVENVKGPPVHGKTVEIRQENKQFSPRLTVVQPGTSVVFPNFDAVYHNVFSNSPRNSFDLGSSRSGDAPRAVTLTKPGVVEIFCNMHQKMSANVLVVPSPLYSKVRSDGSFRIDNVPVGARRIVAWSPGAKRAEQQVEVTAAGSQVTFALQTDERKAHLNKIGQAYGSYRE